MTDEDRDALDLLVDRMDQDSDDDRDQDLDAFFTHAWPTSASQNC